MTFIQTYTGKTLSLRNPKAININLDDICISLERQCRFNGHTARFYSVAEHCMHVADLLPPQYKVAGLLHDAHEAYLGDVTTPVKRAGISGYEELAAVFDREIENRFHLKQGILSANQVKVADVVCLCLEAQVLMNADLINWELNRRFENGIQVLKEIGISTPQIERVRGSIESGTYTRGLLRSALDVVNGDF